VGCYVMACGWENRRSRAFARYISRRGPREEADVGRLRLCTSLQRVRCASTDEVVTVVASVVLIRRAVAELLKDNAGA